MSMNECKFLILKQSRQRGSSQLNHTKWKALSYHRGFVSCERAWKLIVFLYVHFCLVGFFWGGGVKEKKGKVKNELMQNKHYTLLSLSKSCSVFTNFAGHK